MNSQQLKNRDQQIEVLTRQLQRVKRRISEKENKRASENSSMNEIKASDYVHNNNRELRSPVEDTLDNSSPTHESTYYSPNTSRLSAGRRSPGAHEGNQLKI